MAQRQSSLSRVCRRVSHHFTCEWTTTKEQRSREPTRWLSPSKGCEKTVASSDARPRAPYAMRLFVGVGHSDRFRASGDQPRSRPALEVALLQGKNPAIHVSNSGRWRVCLPHPARESLRVTARDPGIGFCSSGRSFTTATPPQLSGSLPLHSGQSVVGLFFSLSFEV